MIHVVIVSGGYVSEYTKSIIDMSNVGFDTLVGRYNNLFLNHALCSEISEILLVSLVWS